MKKIVFTTGDPAGIGPEVITKGLRFYPLHKDIAYIVVGRWIQAISGHQPISISDIAEAKQGGTLYLYQIDDPSIQAGHPSKASGSVALRILDFVEPLLRQGVLDGIVTGPIAKNWIQMNDPDFIGHTEFFANRCGVKNYVMSFWSPWLQLALLTTHLSLRSVGKEVMSPITEERLKLLYTVFSRIRPKSQFVLLGVNPHASENGAFGEEDIYLTKVLSHLKEKDNINIAGPVPADTFFLRKLSPDHVVIAASHDQGLIPFKMIAGDHGVNVTLGLPYWRASVDHGTGFDIAEKGIASAVSLLSAVKWIEERLDSTTNHTSSYSSFASIYDQYMQHVDYDLWVNDILRFYETAHSFPPKHILELACGTGNIANRFSQRGYVVEASDNSPEMLAVAGQKATTVAYRYGDMLSPLQKEKYDLIVCLFDSINYLLHPEDLLKLFHVIYDGLIPGGIFVFDISTMNNSYENFDSYFNIEEYQDHFVVHLSDFDESSMIQHTKLHLFSEQYPFYRRSKETHRQKVYRCIEILQAIENSKLELKGIFEPGGAKNLSSTNPGKLDHSFNRLFFVVGKNESLSE